MVLLADRYTGETVQSFLGGVRGPPGVGDGEVLTAPQLGDGVAVQFERDVVVIDHYLSVVTAEGGGVIECVDGVSGYVSHDVSSLFNALSL